MAYELDWQFKLNDGDFISATVAEQARRSAWWLAGLLTGRKGTTHANHWTVVGSSDGVTAGLDAVDRWQLAGPFDQAKIPRGTASAARGWMVLKSPVQVAGSYWYLILSNDQASDNLFSSYFSKAAPTGGTTTARPTATDEWAPVAATPYITTATAGTVRYCAGLSSRGDFWFAPITLGAQQSWPAWLATWPDGCHPADDYPFYTYRDVTGTSSPSFTLASVQGRSYLGDAVRASAMILPAGLPGMNFPDALTSRWLALPIHLYQVAAGASVSGGNYRGRIMDTSAVPRGSTARASGSTIRVAGAVTHVLLGELLLPCNGDVNLS